MTQTIPDTMQAAAIDRFGGIDPFKLQTLPVPEVGPDEVLIRVECAGVGVWDPWEREGLFRELFRESYGVEPTFPYVIGFDGAGTVAAVGEDITRFKEGDRVYADRHLNPKGGFYAEYAVVNAHHVSPVPGDLTVAQAGAMPVDAITALLGLDDTLGLTEGVIGPDLRRQRRSRALGGTARQTDGCARVCRGFGRGRRGADRAAGRGCRGGRAQS